MDVHTRSGHIELALPSSAKFDLTATTNRGEISNEFGSPMVLEQDRKGRGRSMRGSNGGSAVNLVTDRGDIVVRAGTAGEAELAPSPRVEKGKAEAPSKPPIAVEQ